MANAIAYFIHTFPQYSSTFINDEVDEMRRQGATIRLFAVQRPSDQEFPPAFKRFRDETRYVFPMHFGLFFLRHLNSLLTRPAPYLGVLSSILRHEKLNLKEKRRTLFHFAEAIYLYPEIRKSGCNHIHVHFLLGNASIAYFLAKVYGLTYSLTAHGSDIFVEKVFQSEKLSESLYTRVATEYNANVLKPLLGMGKGNRLQVIPFGIEKPQFVGSRKTNAASKSIRIVSVGRLIWQKAQSLLVQACEKLVQEGFDFHLRLIGEGPLRNELETQVKNSGLNGVITFVGALPRDEVWQEYSNADLFVLSSVSEGSPIVILEAIASGLPVIAPALHGIPEMFHDGEEGLLFETGSMESLTHCLRKVLQDETLRTRLGNAAEKYSKQLDHSYSVGLFRQGLQASLAGISKPSEAQRLVPA
jgi:colanic acid/amylovoran biosynthesis glycosyltransferase